MCETLTSPCIIRTQVCLVKGAQHLTVHASMHQIEELFGQGEIRGAGMQRLWHLLLDTYMCIAAWRHDVLQHLLPSKHTSQ